MTRPTPPGSLYVAARRVLLDALVALQPHMDAVIVIGAQAVYLRTRDRMPNYQPFTTDADLVINPGRLATDPLLGDAMRASGFRATREPGIWIRTFEHPDFDDGIAIPVDLIVPLPRRAQSRPPRRPPARRPREQGSPQDPGCRRSSRRP